MIRYQKVETAAELLRLWLSAKVLSREEKSWQLRCCCCCCCCKAVRWGFSVSLRLGWSKRWILLLVRLGIARARKVAVVREERFDDVADSLAIVSWAGDTCSLCLRGGGVLFSRVSSAPIAASP